MVAPTTNTTHSAKLVAPQLRPALGNALILARYYVDEGIPLRRSLSAAATVLSVELRELVKLLEVDSLAQQPREQQMEAMAQAIRALCCVRSGEPEPQLSSLKKRRLPTGHRPGSKASRIRAEVERRGINLRVPVPFRIVQEIAEVVGTTREAARAQLSVFRRQAGVVVGRDCTQCNYHDTDGGR